MKDAVFGTGAFGETEFNTVYCDESVDVGDSLVKVQLIQKTISEVINVSESLIRGFIYSREVSETITISASLSKTQTLERSASETVSLSDNVEGIELEEMRHKIKVLTTSPKMMVKNLQEGN